MPFRFGKLVALRRFDPLEARSFLYDPMFAGEAGHSSANDHQSSLDVIEGRLDGAATESPLNFLLLYRRELPRHIALLVDWGRYDGPIGSYVPL